MLKLKLLFLVLILISSCTHSPNNKREFNGEVKSSKEYLIKINSNQENELEKDTLAITNKDYKKNNQITKLIELRLDGNEKVEVDYVYNSNNKLQKEIVSISPNSTPLIINYYYKGSLLDNTFHETRTENYYFKQVQNFKYDLKKRKIQSTNKQLYIDLESDDTILNSVEINEFNKESLLTKTYYYDYVNPTKDFSVIYNYRDTILASVKEYGHDKSLKNNSTYKYNFDDCGNWIERKVIQNDSLKFIEIREITYN